MNKEDLLFYQDYENFYLMAGKSKAFADFCREAFGEDLSQDGFSDISQVDMILPYIKEGRFTRVLDIGCGNGKLLRYLQHKKDCSVAGFDYSANAIETAKNYNDADGDFKVGIIGEIEYPNEYFDVIVSMDTMYFAKDMTSFVGQIKSWLKADGTLFIAYQEGDIMPKTSNEHTTMLAEALKANSLEYKVIDITRQTYDLLRKKRQAAINHKQEFIDEGNEEWLDMLMWQTDCATEDYEQFALNMSRYIYVVKR